MAKRFTDTEKWRKPWYRKLSSENKVLWQYFLDNCDHAGIIKLDADIIEMDTSIATSINKIEVDFKGKVFRVSEEHHFIPKFITFQYSEKFLNNNDKCGNSARSRLSMFGISISCKNGKLVPEMLGASEELARSYAGAMVTVKVIDTVKDIVTATDAAPATKESKPKQKDRRVSRPLSVEQINRLEEILGEKTVLDLSEKYCMRYVVEQIPDMKDWLLEKLGTKEEKTDVGARRFVSGWLGRGWDKWQRMNPEELDSKFKARQDELAAELNQMDEEFNSNESNNLRH
jgi:hypothetical protein